MPAQNTPADYYYTEDDPILSFVTQQFTVNPDICQITYSCTILTGGIGNICDVADGQTNGIFDDVTGEYTFMSNDIVNYPPGTYTMEITGTSGAKFDKFTVDLTLVNPCFTVDLRYQPNPFSDHVYVLRDPMIELDWQAVDLINPDTTVDCGHISVEFFNDDAGLTALDPDLFIDDQKGDPDNIFRIIYAEDISKKGSYPIRYRVFPTDYSSNVVEQPFPFVVTVINQCENPFSISAPILDD